MTDCRQRKIDVVLVWKLDRLFRSLKSMVVTLQEWGDLGIEFVSVTDSIDLASPTGRLMMHLISAFAEFEVSLVRSRVKAGLEAARARGARIGRPPLDPALIRQVIALRAEGNSIRQIERSLNRAVSRGSIVRILKQAVQKPSANPDEKSQPNRASEED
jgi:putative DNA-invertase from lambdoid prophage Rac